MRFWHVFLGVALIVGALLLQGCDCEPETDDELCDGHCGVTTLIDDCGESRNVDCGGCSGDDICEDDVCVCEPEDSDQLCDQIDAECGVATTTDRCDNEREIFCGGCQSPNECVDNRCECVGEDDEQLCNDHDMDCGEATVEDSCGNDRTIDCGDCVAPGQCIDNLCECIGEDDDELCAEHALECGEATLEDSCGNERTVDCQDCPSPDQCVDNHCECIGEDDDELCIQLGACGIVDTTDQCGDERTIDCQDCPQGDSTFGAVRDGATGELIDDAEIRVYQWPPAGGEDNRWEWPEGYRHNDPDMSTTTSEGLGDFNFEFASDEPICLDDQIESLEPGQWYRYVVDHPDYDPGIFYRPHGHYSAGDCPSECPTGDNTRCQRHDFELFEEGSDYSRYPNLVVDQRDLHSHEYQCALLPPEADYDRLIGLRVRLGAANVGPGPFHLQGDADDNQVFQHVEHTDGSVDTHNVDSEFYDHDAHGHIHFMNWFRMALVDPTDECRDVDDRSDGCVTHGGQKLSYCLHDLEPFDGDVASSYGGESSLFPDPPVCDTNDQGVTQGWIDTYNRHLPGQLIMVGQPEELSEIGTRWIEGEVDPDQVLQEVERHGNVARITVDVPDDGDALCSDSGKVLDCSVPRSQYDTSQQHRQCGDYLDYAGVD